MKPLRKTITTLSRSITFTQNWWASTALLFLFALLLSCREDELTLGFKKDPKSFEVFYRELPVQTSTLLVDSLLTYNNFASNVTNRLLVGSYTDPTFGKVTSQFFTQIIPSNSQRVPETGAVYDSVTLKLRLDYYWYGSRSFDKQIYQIYQISDEIDNTKAYYNTSSVKVGREPIGRTSVSPNPAYLDELASGNISDTLLLTTILNKNIGRQIFDHWVKQDTTFTKFELFKKEFKGIAIVPETTDKILGFDPTSSLSKLVLHYHVDTVKYDFDFYLIGNTLTGFTNINSEKSGTKIDGLQRRVEFLPDDGLNYVHGGVGVFSKIDFQCLLTLKDTVGLTALNSAELVIPVDEFDAGQPPPNTLAIQLLNSDNSLPRSGQLTFNQQLVYDQSMFAYYMTSDPGSVAVLRYDSARKAYGGFITRFAHALMQEDEADKRFQTFAILPYNPSPEKAVHRFRFDRSKIKLNVYYTKPLTATKTE